jgi:hypothetical protein
LAGIVPSSSLSSMSQPIASISSSFMSAKRLFCGDKRIRGQRAAHVPSMARAYLCTVRGQSDTALEPRTRSNLHAA